MHQHSLLAVSVLSTLSLTTGCGGPTHSVPEEIRAIMAKPRYASAAAHWGLMVMDAKTNEVRWTREKPKGEVNSVVVVGPLAIFTTKEGELVALDRQSGIQRMAYDFKVAINAQPIVAEGWMYVATGDGRVLAFELGNPATLDGWHMWGGNAQHNL